MTVLILVFFYLIRWQSGLSFVQVSTESTSILNGIVWFCVGLTMTSVYQHALELSQASTLLRDQLIVNFFESRGDMLVSLFWFNAPNYPFEVHGL
jgi:small neutral amino acid transporter SnatA (MarC family)